MLLPSLALALSVAAAVVEAPLPPKVLVLDLEATGVAADDGEALDRLVLAELSTVDGVEVVSAGELRRLVALEAEKQALGCDEASCLAELAGALGARFVVFGAVSKLGERTTLTLSLFDERRAAIERETATATSIAALAPEVRPTIARLLGRVGVDVPVQDAPRGPGPLVWVGGAGAGVGALATLAAAAVLVVAELDVQTAARDAADKERSQWIGRGALVGGAAALALVAGGGAVLALGLVE